MTKAPMNRKITGSAKAPKTMSPGASSAFGPTSRTYLRYVEQHGQCQPEHRRHRDRDSLRQPVDYDESEYGGHRVLVSLERQRREVHDQEHYGTEDEADRLPSLLEPLLRRGEHLPLLVERAVGSARPYVLSHRVPTSCNARSRLLPKGSITFC